MSCRNRRRCNRRGTLGANVNCRRRNFPGAGALEDAYNAGYDDGYCAGVQDGMEDGYCAGYEQGQRDGCQDTKADAINCISRIRCR